MPAASIAIQTFGDLLEFNPHCQVLCTDGCFDERGLFQVAPRFASEGLKAIFEYNVFRMLLSEGKITQDLVLMLRSWRHFGFRVFVAQRTLTKEEEGMEKLACYIIRASFSQDRMTYLPGQSKVIYESKACPRHRSDQGHATFMPDAARAVSRLPPSLSWGTESRQF